MKKIFLIIFLILVFFSLFSYQIEAAGLVPCGRTDPDATAEERKPCQFCHLFVLFDNIIKFLLFTIVPPLAILMIAIAGFMYIFAYLNPEEALPGGGKGGPALLSQAKKIFTSVAFALIIIYAAWLIVGLFFQLIGVANWTGLKTWWKINCPT